MKWFMLVIMMGQYADGTNDIYIYTEPALNSLEHCQSYVYNNSATIRQDMQIKFNGKGIEKVFCMREDKLQKFKALAIDPGINA